LETQAALVVPKEGGEIEMFVSTQNANQTQVKFYFVDYSFTIMFTFSC